LVTLLVDFLFMPVIRVGRNLTETVRQINIFSISLIFSSKHQFKLLLLFLINGSITSTQRQKNWNNLGLTPIALLASIERPLWQISPSQIKYSKKKSSRVKLLFVVDFGTMVWVHAGMVSPTIDELAKDYAGKLVVWQNERE